MNSLLQEFHYVVPDVLIQDINITRLWSDVFSLETNWTIHKMKKELGVVVLDPLIP